MGPLLPFWMWHCQGPDAGLLSESDLGVIGIGAKHFYQIKELLVELSWNNLNEQSGIEKQKDFVKQNEHKGL